MSQTTAFPDPECWIDLPRSPAKIHRADLKPCQQCGATLFTVVHVRRPAKTDSGYPLYTEDVSVECPRCQLCSIRRGDLREQIARLDVTRGLILDIKPEPARSR